MSEIDDLPEPIEANPDACPKSYRSQRARAIRNISNRNSFEATSREGSRRAMVARLVHGPVTVRRFSFEVGDR